jgi:hypothetical protein
MANNKIEPDLPSDGSGIIKAARPAGSISGFVGLLAGRTQKVATIEEINEAAAQGWAGKYLCRFLLADRSNGEREKIAPGFGNP